MLFYLTWLYVICDTGYFVFARNLALDQPPEASIVSIQLAAPGDMYTLPIKFSLLKAGTFASRARILSKNGIIIMSHFYSGPWAHQ